MKKIVFIVALFFAVSCFAAETQNWQLQSKQHELEANQQALRATHLEMQMLTDAYKKDQAKIQIFQKKIKDLQEEIKKLEPKGKK